MSKTFPVHPLRPRILEGPRRITLETLRKVLTEENTDAFLDVLFLRLSLPWWIPGAVARRVLDAILPEKLLGALAHILGGDPEEPASSEPGEASS